MGSPPTTSPVSTPAVTPGPSPEQKALETLKEEISHARAVISKLEQDKAELMAQAAQLKEELVRKEETKLDVSPVPPPISQPSATPEHKATDVPPLDPETKVELLGAKAIAEFKAKKLAERLEKVANDLNAREQELQAIRRIAEEKDSELKRLRATIEQLQAQEQQRTAELIEKIDFLSKELATRGAEVNRLEQALEERTSLLEALKTAIKDSSTLKTTLEAEINRARQETSQVQTQLEQTRREVEKAQLETQKFQAEADTLREQLSLWQEAAQRLQAETDRLRKEAKELYARLAATGVPAVPTQPPPEGRTPSSSQSRTSQASSPVDVILQLPLPYDSPAPRIPSQ